MTPVDRIRAAIQGKPAGAYAGVCAADVVAAGSLLKKHSKVTAALAAGARRVVDERPDLDPGHPRLQVFQLVWQLSELVGLVPPAEAAARAA